MTNPYQKEIYAILDQINILPYINKYPILSDLMYQLGKDFNNTPITQNDLMEGYLLNCLDEYDMMLYIADRYNIVYRETITYKRI